MPVAVGWENTASIRSAAVTSALRRGARDTRGDVVDQGHVTLCGQGLAVGVGQLKWPEQHPAQRVGHHHPHRDRRFGQDRRADGSPSSSRPAHSPACRRTSPRHRPAGPAPRRSRCTSPAHGRSRGRATPGRCSPHGRPAASRLPHRSAAIASATARRHPPPQAAAPSQPPARPGCFSVLPHGQRSAANRLRNDIYVPSARFGSALAAESALGCVVTGRQRRRGRGRGRGRPGFRTSGNGPCLPLVPPWRHQAHLHAGAWGASRLPGPPAGSA